MKWVLSLVSFFFIFSSQVHAQEAWEITQFSSDITIAQSGEVAITEKIDVDFFDTEKHGIYRDIPVTYTNEDGSKYHTEIKNIQITNNQYKVTREGDFVRIRIGDPDRTISGAHTYQISYTAVGVLRGFSTFDELYWNVTGNNWEVPMGSVSATITLAGGTFDNADCFIGAVGSVETCSIQMNDEIVTATGHTLQPYEGMTIAVAYPKGITALPTVKSFGKRLFSLPALVTFLFVLITGIGAILLLWSQKGRDLWYRGTHLFDENAKEEKRPFFHKDTTVVEYTPPDKLRPAEIGVLMDERADTLDVTGTIIDLAARGFLTIEEIDKKWVFGSRDYTFTKKKKDTAELIAYEKELLTRLFDSKESVKMSELKQKFYTDLKKVKDQLYHDMVEKGFFPSNPENVRSIYLVIAIILIVLSGFIMFSGLGVENEYFFMGGIAGIVNGINLLIFSQFMSRRTAKGYEMYRRIKGYRLFIENVEKHRQKFFENKNMFNEVLPYAIIFGLTAKFAKALKNMGYKPETSTASWYTGMHVMNLAHFESSMSDFSKSLGTAMASTPSSSSGSGGGGFSGGGFGGGGGGSW
ncbi:MAG TPA: DUF2207 domain-containing protein [Candidatus Levybacteria bacterium]|nr:DUF2207 domain-containing protein [Candidatus Levybacteria bacterium]